MEVELPYTGINLKKRIPKTGSELFLVSKVLKLDSMSVQMRQGETK